MLLSPLSLGLFWGIALALGFSGNLIPGQILFGIVLILIVPGVLSAVVASWVESAFHPNRPDRARRWGWRSVATALLFVSPFVFLPLLFVLVLRETGGTEEEHAAARVRARRPIVESDSIGFCSVPVWTVSDGRPELTIAVRVPEAASYALMAQGDYGRRQLPSGGWSSRGATGMTIRDLDAGVDTMTVRLDNGGGPIEWPVAIRSISLSYSDGRGDIDGRGGDSLYIIDSTGVRTGAD